MWPVIALWVLSSPAGASEVFSGVSGAMLGWQGSARHQVLPAAAAWTTAERGDWAISGEAMWSHQTNRTPLYRFSTHYVRLAATADLSVGSHAARFHAGIGPALGVSIGPGAQWLPGVRARIALHSPIGPHIAVMWCTGAVLRPRGIDYDAQAGLGWRW